MHNGKLEPLKRTPFSGNEIYPVLHSRITRRSPKLLNRTQILRIHASPSPKDSISPEITR